MRFHGKEKYIFEQLVNQIWNNFTYEFWIKPEAPHRVVQESKLGVSGKLDQRFIIGAGYSDHERIAGMGVSVGTNGISVFEHTKNHFPATLVYESEITNWTHIAIVYYQKTPYLFINGEFKKMGLRSSKRYVVPSGIIGGLETYGNFVGEVREIRIWDHVRTVYQIKENVNKNLNSHESGLIRLWNDNKQFQKESNQIKQWQEDSNLEFERNSSLMNFSENLIDIVIPIYNGLSYTENCINRVLKNTNIPYNLYLINDCSTDKEVKYYLDSLREIEYPLNLKNLIIIHNENNLGFIKSVNKAMSISNNNIILLNSDTKVPIDWARRLIMPMNLDNKIASVTPFSNSGSQCSFPVFNQDNELPKDYTVDELDAIFQQQNFNQPIVIPTGVGFCLALNREVIKQIGLFDDETFGQGYFEENDWCMRAIKAGYKNVLVPNLFVYHKSGASFNQLPNNKQHRILENSRKIDKKHPEHFPMINKFVKEDPIKPIRDALITAVTKNKKNNNNVLMNGKVILVIDDSVPMYDLHAGAKTTFQYLKLFKEIGLDVKFIGDDFLRHEPYTSELQNLGIEVLSGSWNRDNINDWIIKNGENISYVFLNRPNISIKYINIIKEYTRAKIFYYGHDLHFLRSLRQYQISRRSVFLREYQKYKAIEDEIYRKVDVVYYPSHYEINEVKRQNPLISAKVIPGYIFENLKEDKGFSLNEKFDLLFVGGFNHSPNVDAVRWFVTSIFPEIVRQIPNIKLYVVGSNPPNEIKNLNSNNIIVTGYVSETQLNQFYKHCRLVVAPLRYGAGVKGKVVEAMFNHVPVITTSIGAEGIINSDNFLTIADNPQDFISKTIDLYNNENLLQRNALLSLENAKKYFSKERALNVLLEDF